MLVRLAEVIFGGLFAGRNFVMSVEQMYRDFRGHFPDIAVATDTKHQESVFYDDDQDFQPSWFETLAHELSDRMSVPDQREEIAAVFEYMDQRFRTGNDEIKNCIDVWFVENLFYSVPRQVSRLVWPMLPKNLQKLYMDVFNYTSCPF